MSKRNKENEVTIEFYEMDNAPVALLKMPDSQIKIIDWELAHAMAAMHISIWKDDPEYQEDYDIHPWDEFESLLDWAVEMWKEMAEIRLNDLPYTDPSALRGKRGAA